MPWQAHNPTMPWEALMMQQMAAMFGGQNSSMFGGQNSWPVRPNNRLKRPKGTSHEGDQKNKLVALLGKIKRGSVLKSDMIYETNAVDPSGGAGHQCTLRLPTLAGHESTEFT